MTNNSIIKEIIALTKKEKDYFFPLKAIKINLIKNNRQFELKPDCEIVFNYKKRKKKFIVQVKSNTSLKSIQEGIAILKNFYTKKNENLMLLVPYINKNIADMVMNSEVNAIDLNGNYFIQTNDLIAIRLDKINKYKQSTPIKKIFSQNSSIVSRLLLSKNRTYKKINEIHEEINKLGGGINLPTISKVLKRLDEELIIRKENSKIILLQPEKLIELLKNDYTQPKIISQIKLKLPVGPDELESCFSNIIENNEWVRTGESSAEYYTATNPIKIISVYVKNLKKIEDKLKKYEDNRFFNYIIYETNSNFVYFDKNKFWSSRLQCYLELSQLDKREKELAGNIKNEILREYNV